MSAADDAVIALASKIAEITAYVRGSSGGNVMNDFLRDTYKQFASFGQRKGLFYRPAVISMAANITGAGVATAANAEFRISAEEDFIVQSVRGFIVLKDQANEPVLITTALAAYGATMTPADRAKAKALNCLVTLVNKDTKVPVMENQGIVLSTICPDLGGLPLFFSPDIVPSFLLPRNYTVQAQFALQSANYMFNTASTDYGIALVGAYVNPGSH